MDTIILRCPICGAETVVRRIASDPKKLGKMPEPCDTHKRTKCLTDNSKAPL